MSSSSRLLHDPRTGDWIILAPQRKWLRGTVRDPFSVERLKTEKVIATYGKGNQRIVVIENRYPVLSPGPRALGTQELLIEGRKTSLVTLLRVSLQRMRALQSLRGIKCLILFKNVGQRAGASRVHPHSQLFALSFVPKRLARTAALRERIDPTFVIWRDREVVAYVHPCGRFPYEVSLTTVRRIVHLTQASPAQIVSFAKALRACTLFAQQRKFSYNLFFHDALRRQRAPFEIRFVPRTNIWGGFELDTGVIVNPVPPEQAAKMYRSFFKRRRLPHPCQAI